MNWHCRRQPRSCLLRPVTHSEMTHACAAWICLDASRMKHKRDSSFLTFIGAHQLKGGRAGRGGRVGVGGLTCQTLLIFPVSLCVCVCVRRCRRSTLNVSHSAPTSVFTSGQNHYNLAGRKFPECFQTEHGTSISDHFGLV